MLPNHAPLVIAEQFGTLESMYPGRIDLGFGRAPGTDPATAPAVRLTCRRPHRFPQDVLDLLGYLAPQPNNVRVPQGRAERAALHPRFDTLSAPVPAIGLPFAFASHFAPAQMMRALQMYQSDFRASAQLARPYSILGVILIAAETDEQARFLATSGRESFANLRRGMPTKLPPPNRDFEKDVESVGTLPLEELNSIAMVGSASTVLEGFRRFIALTAPDELMIVSHIYDHAARIRSSRSRLRWVPR